MSETNDIDNKLLGCIGAVAMVPVAIAYPVLLGGIALQAMWSWFIVPLFHAPALSLAAAIGVDLVVTTLRGSPQDREATKKERERGTMENVVYRMVNITVFYAFVLGIGYVIKAVWL